MMANEEHWVQRLFSPQFSVQDFFEQSCEPESLTSEKQSHERAKRVEKIYNIANKNVEDEETQKRKEYISKMIIHEYEPKLSEKVTDYENITGLGDMLLFLGDGNHASGTNKDTCIWKPKEMATFRQEMRKKHSEGEAQRIQLFTLNANIAELKTKLKKTEEAYDNVQRDLVKAKRKSTCYAINVKQIEKANAKHNLELQFLREELQEKSKAVSSLNKDLCKARLEIQDLVLQNKDYRKQLNELKQKHELIHVTFIEKEKLKYHLQLKKMSQEIEAIKEEMKNEKLLHARNLSALELLRKHFSALPPSIAPDNFKVNYLQQ